MPETENFQRAVLDEEEAKTMAHLSELGRQIEAWGLRANHQELIGAIHVIQGFITQHMLQRIEPGTWSRWYDDE